MLPAQAVVAGAAEAHDSARYLNYIEEDAEAEFVGDDVERPPADGPRIINVGIPGPGMANEHALQLNFLAWWILAFCAKDAEQTDCRTSDAHHTSLTTIFIFPVPCTCASALTIHFCTHLRSCLAPVKLAYKVRWEALWLCRRGRANVAARMARQDPASGRALLPGPCAGVSRL